MKNPNDCRDSMCGAYDCTKCGDIDEEWKDLLDTVAELEGDRQRENEARAREDME